MKSREDDRYARTEFACFTGAPPYAQLPIRSRSGLKHTVFQPTIGQFTTDYKLHNTYLKPDFFTDPIEEYWAIRKTAGLLDVTGEEILEIKGTEAEALLDSVMPRNVCKMKDGHCYYSVLMHDYGGIVEDGILVRFDKELFWWIGGPGNSEECLYMHGVHRDVSITSFNDSIHVASLQGPDSRSILQEVCEADLSVIPFYGMVQCKVCGVDVTVTRTGYTAELGYDIYVDVAHGAQFFADLWTKVRERGGALCGSKSLGIRRIEAAILNFGHDFDWQHTPHEVGLGWMVSDTKAPFHAQEALRAVKAIPPRQKLIGLKLNGTEVPLVGDAMQVAGQDVGIVTSATGSPALGYPIAIGWIDIDQSALGTEITVDLGGRPARAIVVAMPFLDPERKLSKA